MRIAAGQVSILVSAARLLCIWRAAFVAGGVAVDSKVHSFHVATTIDDCAGLCVEKCCLFRSLHPTSQRMVPITSTDYDPVPLLHTMRKQEFSSIQEWFNIHT